jgi:hypothetical protein
MRVNINEKLVSWASEIDELTVAQAQSTARLPIVRSTPATTRASAPSQQLAQPERGETTRPFAHGLARHRRGVASAL